MSVAAELIVSPEATEAAERAGLRYVSDLEPGIRRIRHGKGFRYVGPDGRAVNDRETLRRIRSIVIPPAWTEVWICTSERGHIQAVGRDAKRRKQYRYHADWRAVRDETKFEQLIAFGRMLPALRRRVERDLGRTGLPREKVLAAVVRLLDATGVRVGNEEYARANGSFGLTTLRDRHVEVDGGSMRFEFRGKSGKHHRVELEDRRLAKIIKSCQDIPGYELFQYVSEDGEPQCIDSSDVNAYLAEIAGTGVTAKVFRTWNATVRALAALRRREPATSPTAARRTVAEAIREVANHLGNTLAVCRKSYVHPAVIEGYVEGSLAKSVDTITCRGPKSRRGLDSDERTLLAYLETSASRPRRAAKPAPTPASRRGLRLHPPARARRSPDR